MRRLLFIVPALLLGGFLAVAPGQQSPSVPKQGAPDPGMARLRVKLNPEFPNWSPEYVAERCAEHLATVNKSYRCNIRYLDFSDVPRDLLPAAVSSIYFGTNSLHIAPLVAVPRPVPNTDNRIFWFDLLWYRWTPEVWENITHEDPYFREPLIPSTAKGWAYIREQTGSAGPIVRASWFNFYAFNTTEFLAKGEIKADNAFYYQLVFGFKEKVVDEKVVEKVKVRVPTVKRQLYSDGYRQWYQDVTTYEEKEESKEVVKQVKKKVVNAPATAAEFEAFFRLNFKDLKDFPIDVGATVDEGFSGVSYRNRVLWRVRGNIGTYWRTYDVFRSVGDQDFIESPFPKEFDAGEHIFQDAKGAQFYMLSDGAGKRVEFGDPRVVSGAPAGHPAVITAIGCIKCHDNGIIGFRNEHQILDKIGVKLYGLGYERSERFKQFFLNPRMERLVKLDQEEYAEFIRSCNGLTPQENAAQFEKFRTWYGKPVTLAQAAREIGCEPKELEEAIGLGVGDLDYPQGATKARLGRLVLDGHPIPRQTWERGLYQEAFLLLLERRKHAKMPRR